MPKERVKQLSSFTSRAPASSGAKNHLCGSSVMESASFEPAIAHGPLPRKQHPATISGVCMQPHTLAVRNASQVKQGVHRAGVGAAKDANEAHRPYTLSAVLGDGRLERIDPHLENIIRRQGAEPAPLSTETCLSSEA